MHQPAAQPEHGSVAVRCAGLVTHSAETILLTTPYLDEAEGLCDRVAIIDRGKVIALDAPRALVARSAVMIEGPSLAGVTSELGILVAWGTVGVALALSWFRWH
jgi:hypothetical protein